MNFSILGETNDKTLVILVSNYPFICQLPFMSPVTKIRCVCFNHGICLKLKLKLETETWNWNLKVKPEIESKTWNWNLELN